MLVSAHGFDPVARALATPQIVQVVRAWPHLPGLQLIAGGHILFAYVGPNDRARTAAVAAQRGVPAVERGVLPAEHSRLGLAPRAVDNRRPDSIALPEPDVLLWNRPDASRDDAPAMYGTHGYLPDFAGLQGVLMGAVRVRDAVLGRDVCRPETS